MKPDDVVRALADTTPLPNCAEELTFNAPWEAQAFALVVQAHERNLFTWPEWASHFAPVLADFQSANPSDPETYYKAWLHALEDIMAEKNIADQSAQSSRLAAWERATLATPHGEPILLTNDPLHPAI
ncbi:nitrile hydratase accessory protein [Agrobacterium rubi]|uniref:nitrile hydratase accessory protein n=1 Tax=Agrobacterium rubi TaxID=28099 RepID=UPI00157228B9|nr:nitrile hydratase accessory protein [Agrobacterium rubi]NTF10506.1 nitrile hydratase accessory protein [Agrobacterium rubi]NTF22900.1 nitrile hydratase accessory protein [Agrobacterium rubi]NTF29831.1 nitrile hydratase accessory protein [Agrobacterium rubi]